MLCRNGLLIFAALAIGSAGCRFKGAESMNSTKAPHTELPYKSDPYTWGGIAEGTGGQVAATRQSMESPTYAEPKFKNLAGSEGFTSMSGWNLKPAKPSDIPGDHQPLPDDADHDSNAKKEDH
jgi:hypothetical protein